MLQKNPEFAQKYVREVFFKGSLSSGEYRSAMENAQLVLAIDPKQIDVTAFIAVIVAE